MFIKKGIHDITKPKGKTTSIGNGKRSKAKPGKKLSRGQGK